MLHQDLPSIPARPIDGANRWVVPALGGAALLSVAIVFVLLGWIAAAGLAACVRAGVGVGSILLRDTAAAPVLGLVDGHGFLYGCAF